MNEGKGVAENVHKKPTEWLEMVRKLGVAASSALFLFLSSPVEVKAGTDESRAISQLILEYEKEFKSVNPYTSQASPSAEARKERHDDIAQLLRTYDRFGAREFVERNYTTGDVTKSLNHEFNKDSMRCLVHNVIREAGSKYEMQAGGDWAVIVTTLARAFDPGMRFFGPDQAKEFGNVCGVVKARGQFSWTFDRRILAQPLAEQQVKHYNHVEEMIVREIGGLTPVQALEKLMEKLRLTEKPFYYLHKDMWGKFDVPRADGTMEHVVYGEEPKIREGESQENFTIRYNRYRMTSPETARNFKTLNETSTLKRTIGSQIFFGDFPRTYTAAAQRRIDARRARNIGVDKREHHAPQQ